MTKGEVYDHNSEKEIEKLFLGRRIVSVETGINERMKEAYEYATGLMTLDDGTQVYVIPHQGGCSCGAGDYALTSLATVDNVITSVKVACETTEYEDASYRIYAVADAVEINAVQIDGSDGNGWYGTGFELVVRRASNE